MLPGVGQLVVVLPRRDGRGVRSPTNNKDDFWSHVELAACPWSITSRYVMAYGSCQKDTIHSYDLILGLAMVFAIALFNHPFVDHDDLIADCLL
jgi:hypothetical protein